MTEHKNAKLRPVDQHATLNLNICRVCMKTSPDLTNIFKSIKERRISDMVMECAPIKITAEEGLPSMICSVCMKKLDAVRAFRNMCIYSDKILRQQLNALPPPKPTIKVVSLAKLGVEGDNNETRPAPEVVVIESRDNLIKQEPEEEKEGKYYIFNDSQVEVLLPNESQIGTKDIVEFLPRADSPPCNRTPGTSGRKEDHSYGQLRKRLKRDPLETLPPNSDQAGGSPLFQFVDTNGPPLDDIIELGDEDFCDRCQMQIGDQSLEEHNLVCNTYIRNCPFCGIEQLKVLDFDRHIQDRHIKEYNACKWCHRIFLESRHFDHHNCDQDKANVVVDFRMYICAFCRSEFKNLKALTCHYYGMHYRKYNCMC